MSHHLTEADNLHYQYPDGHKAIDGISFTIHHGESIGIIGANGAGKSTLLLLIMGVFTTTEGEVRVGGIKVTKQTLPLIRQRVGMVFQDPDDQLFMTTVYDDVAFGPRNFRLDEKEVEIRVMQALEKVNIPHLKLRPPFKLSAGEKRAAGIASVLAMNPDILLMDEPGSSLDPQSRRRLINLLKGFEHTKIITSHDLDMVAELCTRILVMKEGRIIADGYADAILSDEKLMADSGLEVPLSMKPCASCGKRIGF